MTRDYIHLLFTVYWPNLWHVLKNFALSYSLDLLFRAVSLCSADCKWLFRDCSLKQNELAGPLRWFSKVTGVERQGFPLTESLWLSSNSLVTSRIIITVGILIFAPNLCTARHLLFQNWIIDREGCISNYSDKNQESWNWIWKKHGDWNLKGYFFFITSAVKTSWSWIFLINWTDVVTVSSLVQCWLHHAVLPGGDPRCYSDAGLLLWVHWHFQSSRAGLHLQRSHFDQTWSWTWTEQPHTTDNTVLCGERTTCCTGKSIELQKAMHVKGLLVSVSE